MFVASNIHDRALDCATTEVLAMKGHPAGTDGACKTAQKRDKLCKFWCC
jgi:hypothetical protein